MTGVQTCALPISYNDENIRQSVLAEKRALALAPKRQRKIIKNSIEAQRKQIDNSKLSAAAAKAQQGKVSQAQSSLGLGG